MSDVCSDIGGPFIGKLSFILRKLQNPGRIAVRFFERVCIPQTLYDNGNFVIPEESPCDSSKEFAFRKLFMVMEIL